eukprot:s4285_g3.t1
MEISQTLIIGSWINAKVADPNANDGFFMWLLTLSCAFCAFLAFSVTAQATNASNTASASIYLDTLGALLRAPIDLFFDKQPVGRLINRLTGDVGTIDVQVPGILTSMFCTAAYIIVAQLWSFSVIPWPLILAAMPFYCIMGYFFTLYANTAISLVTYSKHILSNLQESGLLSLQKPDERRRCSMLRKRGDPGAGRGRRDYGKRVVRSCPSGTAAEIGFVMDLCVHMQ